MGAREDRNMQRYGRKIGFRVVGTVLLGIGLLGAPVPSYSETEGQERREDRRDERQDARDTRQTGREDAHDAKQECREGDEKTLAQCRQEKRASKQDARSNAREKRRGGADAN